MVARPSNKISRNIATMPTPFVSFPLPYRKQMVPFFKEYGTNSIALSSGSFIPYGLYGRYALMALTQLASKASDEKNCSISNFSLYSLLSAFKPQHVQGRQLYLFEQQLIAWSQTLITFSSISSTRKSYKNLLLVDQAHFKLKKNLDEEDVSITFTKEGQEFLSTNSLPFPQTAVLQIEKAFDFDVLAWLIVTVFRVREKDGVFVSWKQLEIQFGVTLRNEPRFRKNFTNTLRDVRDVFYRQAQFLITEEGVAILNSPLLVPQREDISIPVIEDEEDEHDGR